jgi:hypothetical protein
MLFIELIKLIWKYTHLDIFLTHMLQGKKSSIQQKLTHIETFENKVKNFLIQNFMRMESVDGGVVHIYIDFKSPLLHNGCTFIVHKLYWLFLLKVENLKPSPDVGYKWFYGMLMEC